MRLAVAALVGGLLISASAMGASIDVGTHTLLPNTPNQTIDIIIRPGDPVERLLGMDFTVMIDPPAVFDRDYNRFIHWSTVESAGPPSREYGPVFTGLALTEPDMVFARGEAQPGLAYNGARHMVGGLVLDTDEELAPAGGVLARLTLDTTGLAPLPDQDLVYSLVLASEPVGLFTIVWDEFGRAPLTGRRVDGHSTEFPDRISNGWIRIAASNQYNLPVPEPATWLELTVGIAALLSWTLGRRIL